MGKTAGSSAHVSRSIADHMYRMAMLCMLIPLSTTERPLDIGRCVQVRFQLIELSHDPLC